MKAYKYNIAIVGLLCLVVIVAGISAPLTASIQEDSVVRVDNVLIEVERDGTVFYSETVHNLVTTIGKEYIEQSLRNQTYILYEGVPVNISLSDDGSAPAVGWTQIPSEITTGGLERAYGTYANVGDGQWTISHEFTASVTHTNVNTSGLNWKLGNTDDCLFAANNFTNVTLISGDKITLTWSLTASGV